MNKWKLVNDIGDEIPLDSLPKSLDPHASLLIVNGSDFTGLYHLPFSAAQQTLIVDPLAVIGGKYLQTLMLTEFQQEDQAFISKDGKEWLPVSIGKVKTIDNPSFLYLPGKGASMSLEGFQEIIAHLRAPEGCPWDRKQTHASLRPYLLEETYEALDALDRNDLQALKEELGDIILQIALHAQIAQENGEFRMGDVLQGIHNKIVFRHPHVFKDWVVDGEQQVIQNWEALKGEERASNGEHGKKGILDGVPPDYPALAQAQALQERAARVGFDWDKIEPVLDKVSEEIEEIRNAATDKERFKEFGDLLFALVNFIRWNKIDAESSLRNTNNKFKKRFAYIEKSASEMGRSLKDMTLAEMDILWEKAKQFDDD